MMFAFKNALPFAGAGILVLFTVLALAKISASQIKVQRYGTVIGIKPGKIEYYKKLHVATWPGVLKMIKACHIRNYSIYLREIEPGKFYLFSYLEYTGKNFEADMVKMAADATTQEWWKETNPCQIPIPTHGEKEWWSRMEEVFHTD